MSSLHDGHRERLRKKLDGETYLEDHEILELYLFQSIPRCNTNEIAHRLLERFGSIRGVLDADEASLLEVEGVGKKSAFSLHLAAVMAGRYQRSSVNTNSLLSSRADLYQLLQSLFIGSATECVFLLLFNGSGRLLATKRIDNGLPFSSELSVSMVTNYAVKNNAAAVMLAHNHPDGIPLPSNQDVEATLKIREELQRLRIHMIDHFVIAGDQCRSVLYD